MVGCEMTVAVQLCVFATTPPVAGLQRRVCLKEWGKVKVSTNQLIIEKAKRPFGKAKAEPQKEEACANGVFVCRG
jgi:hypothetical protein